MVVYIFEEWAEKRIEWKILPVVADPSHPPPLRMLLLGTAGTGKTYTAKAGITEARLMLESCDSVLTMAFACVAAANWGVGCKTNNSGFHTNRADAMEDLTGELLVIDEISNCGAAALEEVSRRMQQVARVFWRRKFGSEPFRGHWRAIHGRLRSTPAGTSSQQEHRAMASRALPARAVLEERKPLEVKSLFRNLIF